MDLIGNDCLTAIVLQLPPSMSRVCKLWKHIIYSNYKHTIIKHIKQLYTTIYLREMCVPISVLDMDDDNILSCFNYIEILTNIMHKTTNELILLSHYNLYHGHLNIAEITNICNETILMLAIKQNKLELIDKLILFGRDISVSEEIRYELINKGMFDHIKKLKLALPYSYIIRNSNRDQLKKLNINISHIRNVVYKYNITKHFKYVGTYNYISIRSIYSYDTNYMYYVLHNCSCYNLMCVIKKRSNQNEKNVSFIAFKMLIKRFPYDVIYASQYITMTYKTCKLLIDAGRIDVLCMYTRNIISINSKEVIKLIDYIRTEYTDQIITIVKDKLKKSNTPEHQIYYAVVATRHARLIREVMQILN
jgi:hypothetical protein